MLVEISEEDWLTTHDTNALTPTSKERTISAETTVETINVHISVWKYSVRY